MVEQHRKALFAGITIAWEKPKILLGCLVRMIIGAAKWMATAISDRVKQEAPVESFGLINKPADRDPTLVAAEERRSPFIFALKGSNPEL